jgi:hypothetical protein
VSDCISDLFKAEPASLAKTKIKKSLAYKDALKEKDYNTSYQWNKMGFVLTREIASTTFGIPLSATA